VPRVSVIIPTHGRPQWLPRAVASALGAGRDVEVLLVDDASTDGTAEVCRELAQQPGVRHLRLERNQGVAGARNVGLSASTGEYIAFLDDDDLRLPGSLDAQVAALEEYSEAGLSCGGIIVGDQECHPTPETYRAWQKSGDLFWHMLALNIPCLPIAVVVRRECFSRVGLFKPELAGIDDWDLWTRISEFYPILLSREPVCIYRDPLPVSGQGSSNMARHMARAARHQLALLDLPRARSGSVDERNWARRCFLNNVSKHLIQYAIVWTRQGFYSAARANLLMALRLNPRRLIEVRSPGIAKAFNILLNGRTPAPAHKLPAANPASQPAQSTSSS
jgi:glycosyltransferase involved in cell wall biosynthesis